VNLETFFSVSGLMSSSGENKERSESWGSRGYLSSLYDQMSKYFIPTSSQLLHLSQRNLLERFVKYVKQTPPSDLIITKYLSDYCLE
jgi:hypothetical protein